jgi:hypothetical protein
MILVNAHLGERATSGRYTVSADARIVISPNIRIDKDGILLSLLKTAGADDKTLLKVTRDLGTGRGTVAIHVTEKGRKLLQIGPTG